jgi:hypothetical protein
MVNVTLYYIISIDMLIIKTIMIAILAVIAVIAVQQTASATDDSDDDHVDDEGTTTVRVTLDGIDSLTGRVQVQVSPQDGDSKMTIDPFQEGFAGNVPLTPFKFSTEELDNNENVNVCVYLLDHNNIYTCNNDYVEDNRAAVSVQIPNEYQQPSINDKITYYDEDGNVIPNSYVKQGDDSTNTDKDQGSGIGVSFGDNSDHNTVNIDQRSTFADVIRYLVPIAKDGAHMAKYTAAQLLD